jgi:hypothetical protein
MRKCLLPVLSLLLLVSCQSTRSGSTYQDNYPSLIPLEDRVQASRNAQQLAVDQFQPTGAHLASMLSHDGSDLQPIYTTALNDYQKSVEVAVAVSAAIAAVEQTGNGLFHEWQIEIDVLTDARLKADNQAKMREVNQGYQNLLQVLHQSESGMEPVLKALHNNVTSLKNDSIGPSLAARESELGEIQGDIEALVKSLNNAIAVSDAFISSLG